MSKATIVIQKMRWYVLFLARLRGLLRCTFLFFVDGWIRQVGVIDAALLFKITQPSHGATVREWWSIAFPFVFEFLLLALW